MNEKIDLTKILKNCPKGWKFYSSVYGEVEFVEITSTISPYPVMYKLHGSMYCVSIAGELFKGQGECTFFPSREQRDWSKFSAPWYKKDKFDPNTLHPFDKVLVRMYDKDGYTWEPDFFGYIDGKLIMCVSNGNVACIPYNDETKHLVGTNEEAPEYYRYWED